MENNYRITFYNNETEEHTSYDVYAENSDEAFKQAFKMPEAKSSHYTDVSVEEIPKGPSVIAIKFEAFDTVIKKIFANYIFIKANNEKDAVKYYNENFKNKRFWFDAGKTEDDGKHIRGNIIETYFASVPGYHADATI